MLRLCHPLFGFQPPGLEVSEILDIFCGLFACYFPDFYIWLDSTLQNEVIGHFFVILDAKTGVLPNFEVNTKTVDFGGLAHTKIIYFLKSNIYDGF